MEKSPSTINQYEATFQAKITSWTAEIIFVSNVLLFRFILPTPTAAIVTDTLIDGHKKGLTSFCLRTIAKYFQPYDILGPLSPPIGMPTWCGKYWPIHFIIHLLLRWWKHETRRLACGQWNYVFTETKDAWLLFGASSVSYFRYPKKLHFRHKWRTKKAINGHHLVVTRHQYTHLSSYWEKGSEESERTR